MVMKDILTFFNLLNLLKIDLYHEEIQRDFVTIHLFQDKIKKFDF